MFNMKHGKRGKQNEAQLAKVFYDKGEYDLARSTEKRVEGMMTLISLLAIDDIEEWDNNWVEIYNMIHD